MLDNITLRPLSCLPRHDRGRNVMLSNIQQNIIIRALQIRKNQGEEPADILEGYRNLTDDEKAEILETLKE